MNIVSYNVYNLEQALVASGLPKVTLDEAVYSLYEKNLNENVFEQRRETVTKLGSVPIGSGHDCFLKGIIVTATIDYTQYFSMQLQRYHFLDIVSSSSKMHMLTSTGLTDNNCNAYVDPVVVRLVNDLIDKYRFETVPTKKQELFLRIMANTPMGMMLRMQIVTNYLQLKTIYSQRKGDAKRLPEDWGVFLDWILELPRFKQLCGV